MTDTMLTRMALVAFTEADLREAFKAGWKERNRVPGLKRVRRNNLNNAILGAIGGSKYAEHVLIKDDRAYSHSFWLRSACRKRALAKATPTPTQAQDGYEADAIGEVNQGNPNG